MKTIFNTLTRIAVSLALVLAFALGTSWATITFYSANKVFRSSGGTLQIVPGHPITGNKVAAIVPKKALDAYFDEHGIDKIEITVDLQEELLVDSNGNPYYRLNFTFGPSGCYFAQPLQLRIDGQYVTNNPDIWLYDSNGEALEGYFVHSQDDRMIFEIPHFSNYYYDDYSY